MVHGSLADHLGDLGLLGIHDSGSAGHGDFGLGALHGHGEIHGEGLADLEGKLFAYYGGKAGLGDLHFIVAGL